MPGDEIKHLDWKVYGKTERFYIKKFEEETNLKCYILLDTSASMSYSSTKVSKLQYGKYLAAAFSYLMFQQQDAVGLVTFDQTIRTYLPPKAIHSYLRQILIELHTCKGSKKTNISKTFHEMADRIKRRGLIVIFSDLFDEPETIISGLKHFRHNKHEVIVFHILDPKEKTFDFKGDILFEDLETKEQLNTQPVHLLKDYRKDINRFINNFRKMCRENQIDYVLLNTAQKFDKALYEYLVKRKKVG
jgi:uncharacterized protein (DUF58 family)